MGLAELSLAKAQAAASKARAELADLRNKLRLAEAKLSVMKTSDSAVGTMTSPGFLSSGPLGNVTGMVRSRSEAGLAGAQAEVDSLRAAVEAAAGRLNLAEKSLNTVMRITDE